MKFCNQTNVQCFPREQPAFHDHEDRRRRRGIGSQWRFMIIYMSAYGRRVGFTARAIIWRQ